MRLKADDNRKPGPDLTGCGHPVMGEGHGAEGREEPLRTPGERAPELPLHDIMVRLALSSGECVRVAGAGARGTPPFT